MSHTQIVKSKEWQNMRANPKCAYCGKEIKGGYMCSSCHKKLKTVRKLIAICKDIKRSIQYNR